MCHVPQATASLTQAFWFPPPIKTTLHFFLDFWALSLLVIPLSINHIPENRNVIILPGNVKFQRKKEMQEIPTRGHI